MANLLTSLVAPLWAVVDLALDLPPAVVLAVSAAGLAIGALIAGS